MKRVAILTNNPDRQDFSEKMSGITERISENSLSATLHIFRCRVFPGMDLDQVAGEYSIFSLPNLEQYDAFILDLHHIQIRRNNYLESDECRKLIDAVLAYNKPVLSIGNRLKGVFQLQLDDLLMIDSLVEFLTNTQKCRSFWIVSDTSQASYAKERLDFCRDSITNRLGKDADIKTYTGNDGASIECGIRGFDSLMKQQGELPDAVMCADDWIALGVMEGAERQGFHVPEDFFLSGFGNRREGRCTIPMLTTIDTCRRTFGHRCVDILCALWEGKTLNPAKSRISAELILRDSCGHHVPITQDAGARKLVNENVFYHVGRDQFNRHMECLEDELLNCDTINKVGKCFQHSLLFLDCKAFYLVLDEDFSSYRADDAFLNMRGSISSGTAHFPTGRFSDRMKIVFSYKEGKQDVKDRPVRSLFPTFELQDESENYLFIPVHFRQYTVGYFALEFAIHLIQSPYLSRAINALSLAIENLYTRRILEKNNRYLSEISIKDAMTDFYNRLGYQRIACSLFEKKRKNGRACSILFIDMDGLKKMNDQYGHECGDFAICAITKAIHKHCKEDTVKVRMGGDEFLILMDLKQDKYVEKLLESIKNEIPLTEEAGHLPYPPGISVGYIHTDPGSDLNLDAYVKEADAFMYEEKKRKGVARK